MRTTLFILSIPLSSSLLLLIHRNPKMIFSISFRHSFLIHFSINGKKIPTCQTRCITTAKILILTHYVVWQASPPLPPKGSVYKIDKIRLFHSTNPFFYQKTWLLPKWPKFFGHYFITHYMYMVSHPCPVIVGALCCQNSQNILGMSLTFLCVCVNTTLFMLKHE